MPLDLSSVLGYVAHESEIWLLQLSAHDGLIARPALNLNVDVGRRAGALKAVMRCCRGKAPATLMVAAETLAAPRILSMLIDL